jgi:hypothetical protein
LDEIEKKKRLTIPGIVVHPLSVQDIMHRNDTVIFSHSTASNSPQLLHMCADAEQEPKMHAQGANVRAGLARYPKHGQIPLLIKLEEFGFVHGANAQLSLDGGNERWSLEQRTGESLQGTREGGRGGQSRV